MSDKQNFSHKDISKSEFRSVNMSGAIFEDVDLSGSKFFNINLRGGDEWRNPKSPHFCIYYGLTNLLRYERVVFSLSEGFSTNCGAVAVKRRF